MDYRVYHFSIKEIMELLLQSVGITILVAVLFYRSAWAGIGFPIVFYLLYQRTRERKCKERVHHLQEQFLSGMRVLNASLQAGLSMENAWREVKKELKLMHGETSDFYREITEMTNQISVNRSIEKMLLEFAYRTGVEDIITFAEVLDYGKRSGGNWKKIIETTVFRMSEKEDAKKEIEVLIAEKKMEQQVMNIIPLGILGFLQFSSWDYMQVLFHNPLGVFCMTVCLAGYGSAIYLSEKIMQIEV